MPVGFIGAGSMASALARGWGEPVLATDGGSGRAAALVAELGGEALPDNGTLARRAELVVLAHKPAQLPEVAEEIRGRARAVVSLLARTSQAELRAALPGTPVFRVVPNTPVAVRRGVSTFAVPDVAADPELRRAIHERFARVGEVVVLPERLMDAAGGCAGVGPAYWALLVEAQVDAAVRHGIPAGQAATLVGETMAGTAELLRTGGYDTLSVRRAVTSPGGTTARGLAALERGGVRAAFADALDAVVGGVR
jgi:pyrroline-5-carboxylate reductase